MTLRHAAAALVAGLSLFATDQAAADEVVVQRDKSFSQEQVVVSAGEQVVFSNRDTVTHNLFSRSPGFEFEVKAQLPGQDTPVRFERPGVAEVRCAIHPYMRLRVVVEEKGIQEKGIEEKGGEP